jgi:hypothetical protein
METTWQGKVNRLEFCQKHGENLNVLLKAFMTSDSRLQAVMVTLCEEDEAAWANKQTDIEFEFKKAEEAKP